MPNPDIIRLANAVSRLLGWIYTFCWSVSFYPQPLLNLKRHSTTGSTIEYVTLNCLGFSAYVTSTCSLFFSPLIRAQYAARNPVSPEPTVRANDVAFGAHALVLCILTWTMFVPGLWGFEQVIGERKWQRISTRVLGIMAGCVLGVGCVIGIVLVKGKNGGRDPGTWAWIDVIYAVGYVKLVITVVKYIPQAWANYKRKSTVGWSIGQILLDFSGGVLSIMQLVIDSSLQNDWSGLTGNPVKLGLGNISIAFDIVFIIQHYWLYRGAKEVEEDGKIDGERRPLLRNEDEEAGVR